MTLIKSNEVFEEKRGLIAKRFIENDIITLTIEFTPYYDERSFNEFSENSPPMPFVIGPWVCYDLGSKILIELKDSKTVKKFYVPNNLDPVKLKLSLNNLDKSFQVKINGNLSYSGEFQAHEAARNSSILGRGFRKRDWNGLISFLGIESYKGLKQHNLEFDRNKLLSDFKFEQTEDFHYSNLMDPVAIENSGELTRNSTKVSLVIPAYNVEQYLKECLDSAVKQSFLPDEYEVIIVNDASTDSSADIARSYCDKYDHFHLVNHDQNKGLGPARNTGLENAQGEFVFFLDGDDRIAAQCLQNLYIKAKNELSDIVICGYHKVDELGRVLATRSAYLKVKHSRIEMLKQIFKYEMSPMCCSMLIRKSLFTKNDISFPAKLHEDTHVSYKLYFNAVKISVHHANYYYWLTRSGSITSKITMQHIKDWTEGLMGRKQWIERKLGQVGLTEFMVDLNFGMSKAINATILDRIEKLDSEDERQTLKNYVLKVIDESETLKGLELSSFPNIEKLIGNINKS